MDDMPAPESDHLLDPAEEPGTPPGDRRFRPDVEGLRAVAIALVVLYHLGLPRLKAGFIGVDVFFVISGFVITGLLLREQASTGATSLMSFYARRSRRILPMGSLVIVAAVLVSFAFNGASAGNATAHDGRWAAVFLANFYFASPTTNATSPLGSYWSLAVEEQFYLVFPAIAMAAGMIRGRLSFRSRLTIILALVTIASYWLSATQSLSNERLA